MVVASWRWYACREPRIGNSNRLNDNVETLVGLPAARLPTPAMEGTTPTGWCVNCSAGTKRIEKFTECGPEKLIRTS